MQNRGLAGPRRAHSLAYGSLCCPRVGDNPSASCASRAEPQSMHRAEAPAPPRSRSMRVRPRESRVILPR